MEFKEFPKIARLSREVTITEKIDGTNGLIWIGENRDFKVGSRSRWITPEQDNYGFAKWAYENRNELSEVLGPGYHYGEWWGKGIQRNYARTEKIFSLFNTFRWNEETKPKCCSVVPVLWQGPLEEYGVLKGIKAALATLQTAGSQAAPGFMNPEGIMIYHHASKTYFKKTLEKDEMPKGKTSDGHFVVGPHEMA